jgi:diguanylate cyclase (GGDEF)-like protein
MSLLSHRSDRGLVNQLMVPLALAGVFVIAVLGALLTSEARTAAEDGLIAEARAIRDYAAPLAAPEDGKPKRGWPAQLDRVAQAHGARVTISVDGKSRTVGTAQVASPRTYRMALPHTKGGTVFVTLSGHALATATVRSLLNALLAGGAGLLILIVLGVHLVRSKVTLPLAALGASLEGLRSGEDSEDESEGAVAAAREFAAVARTGSHLATTFAELSAQAASDPITGVGNRRFFDSALEVEIDRARRAGGAMGLVLIDFDNFKEVNDTYGHRLGDEILGKVAEKLRGTLRTTDVLARVGGDEFAVILPEMNREASLKVVERMRRDAKQDVEGHELTWSAGIACFPADAVEPGVLLECADAALYCAKNAGTARTCHYDPTDEGVRRPDGERAEVEAVLNDPDAVIPVFQPLVSLSSGQISGYEALTRFPKPPARRPDEWFNLAHRVGLGPALEARALREVLASPGRPAGVYLSFNLSPSALASDVVMEALPASMTGLVIEITEHENVADEEGLLRRLEEMRRRGARVAIDDAGAGYSGLQQVMRLQPDIIKLDRSLVGNVDTDPAKAALIDSFVRFARRTNSSIVAEGIETPEELKVLADLEVDYGQGFGLAPPSPPWAPIAHWVEAAVLHRMMRSSDETSSPADGKEVDDARLAQVTGRLAAMASTSELPAVTPEIAPEVGADEVCILRRVGDELEAVTAHSWLPAGKRLRLSHHPTMSNVLSSRAVVQVMASDGGADLGELALLGQTGFAAMLVTPAVRAGHSVGLMLAFGPRERPWSRVETSRARVIAHQVGAVIGTGAVVTGGSHVPDPDLDLLGAAD